MKKRIPLYGSCLVWKQPGLPDAVAAADGHSLCRSSAASTTSGHASHARYSADDSI